MLAGSRSVIVMELGERTKGLRFVAKPFCIRGVFVSGADGERCQKLSC